MGQNPMAFFIPKAAPKGVKSPMFFLPVLNLSPGTISYHMNYLARVGFVRMSKGGNKINYSLDQAQIEQLLQDLRLQLLEKH